MTPTAVKLPPNPIRHFYRGGPAIAELRGIDVGGDHSPEEWIGSASTLFGESERGLSRMPDGGLVRDALAADPEGWLGAAHAARFGASPALLVKLLDAGERLPVHHHPDHPFAHEHLGRDFGKTEAWIVLAARDGAEVAVGWREDVADETLRAWVDDQDHDALLGALNPVAVSAGDAVFVPAGVPHAIGDGDPHRRAPGAHRPLGPARVGRLRDRRRAGRDARPRVGRRARAASSEPRATRRPCAAHAATAPSPSSCRAAAAAFFSAQRVAPDGGSVQLPAGFAVVIVVEGAGTLAGLDVARGDALLVPHAAGPIRVDGDLVAIACRPPGVPAP